MLRCDKYWGNIGRNQTEKRKIDNHQEVERNPNRNIEEREREGGRAYATRGNSEPKTKPKANSQTNKARDPALEREKNDEQKREEGEKESSDWCDSF